MKRNIPKILLQYYIFIKRFHKVLEFFFIKPFENLRNAISPYMGIVYCKFAECLQSKETSTIKYFIICFNFVPRLVVSIILLIELIVYQRINYFIPAVFILLNPIIWNIFLNLFIAFAKRLLINILTVIEVIPVGQLLPSGWYRKYTFKPLLKYDYTSEYVNEYGRLWIIAIAISGYGEVYLQEYQKSITPYIIIICSSLYIRNNI